MKSKTKKQSRYLDHTLSPKKRVKDLLSRMTLEEKAAQMMCVWQQKADTLVDELSSGSPERCRRRT